MSDKVERYFQMGLAMCPVAIGKGDWVRADDYDALARELAALRKDAERYRWMRDSCGGFSNEIYVTMNIGHDWIAVIGHELDDAIDAAMRPQQP